MTQRKLLCISSRREAALDALVLPLSDWDVMVVPTLAEASRLLASHAYGVGLLIDVVGVVDDATLNTFLRKNASVHWIGLVKASCVASPQAREIISDHLRDYHTFPIDPVRLSYSLGHAHGLASLRHLQPKITHQCSMIGSSPALTRLVGKVARVAEVDAPVLISGESGSGKELAAQAIHAQSSRAGGPFIAINCGALAPELIQSALFGHERGAFTGADKAKMGLIEAADGGTIFLDEIGDLPKALQVHLLRFLQERKITRVGAIQETRVDARVIAATHVDLEAAVLRGDFREDLYYRLAVLPLAVPSLRERADDVPMLADYFFRLYAQEGMASVKGFSRRALDVMQSHAWPGNVRELMNRVRRAVVLSEGHWITAEDLGLGAAVIPQAVPTVSAINDPAISAEMLRSSLQRCGQNMSKAARDLGISRSSLYRLLKTHAIAA